jgi:hypothetical protein
VLGLHEGATENPGAIKALLVDLAEREDESCGAVVSGWMCEHYPRREVHSPAAGNAGG